MRPFWDDQQEAKNGPRMEPPPRVSKPTAKTKRLRRKRRPTRRPEPEKWKRLRILVFIRDNWTCQYCGKGRDQVLLQADHIHPVSLGGSNSLKNLVTSCQPCNMKKSARRLNKKHRKALVSGLMERYRTSRESWKRSKSLSVELEQGYRQSMGADSE